MLPEDVVKWVLAIVAISHAAPIPQCMDDGPQPQKKPKLESKPRCQMLFSEFKLAKNAEDTETYPFIELKYSCPKRPGPQPKNPLGDYKMVILKGNPLTLTMFIDFANFAFDDEAALIVIGSPRVDSVDISLSTPHVQSSFSTTVDSLMLPSISDSAFAVLLIAGLSKTDAKSLHLWITPDGDMYSRVVTTAQAKLLRDKVVDVMIIGEGDGNKLQQFGQFWKEANPNENHVFSSEWSILAQSSAEFSLSLCAEEYKGFNAIPFAVKLESPGKENNCRDRETESSNSRRCDQQPTTLQPLLLKVTSSQIDEMRRKFDPFWIPSCKEFFPKKSQILQSSSIQEWLRFKMDPKHCTFVCVACKNYRASGFRPDIKRKSNIVQQGILSTDIYSNEDAIETHRKTELHKEALEFYQKLIASASEEEVETIIREFEEKEKQTFNATSNSVIFLFASMKAGLSFQAYEKLMVALKLMGTNVGWLQHTDDAAQAIAKSISQTLRIDTLQTLVAKRPRLSLSADSSTNSNQPFLAVYFQTLKDGYPKTYFYALIHMEEGEKAREMTNSFISQIQRDSELVPEFEVYFKWAITSISTDGASVMVGSEHSFKVYLAEYVGRPIPNVVCLAHNLDRAYKVGMKHDTSITDNLDPTDAYDQAKLWQLTFFEKFEASSNKIYGFYMSRGHKKWQHFLRMAEEDGLVPKRLKYIYDIRWSESHFRSLEAIHHNYYSLVEGLQDMSVNKDFDKSAQAKAIDLFQLMTDKTYLLVLHEFLDLLSTFKVASKLFQAASSIIVGKAEIVYTVLNSLNTLQETPGKWLADFLGNVICFGDNEEDALTVDRYDSCEKTVIRGMEIEHQYPVVMHYSEVRGIIYSKLIEAVKKYFKLDLLESFEVINPQKLAFPSEADSEPVDPEQVPLLEDLYVPADPEKELHDYSSYEERASFICTFYHMNPDSCSIFLTEWANVVHCVISNSELQKLGYNDATTFWPVALTYCEHSWTELTKDVLQSVLVTSYSSSECERGFSIMNSIKTKGRSRLEKETLDSIMRVKINGPDLENFYSYAYTIEFLKLFVRVDDPQFQNKFVKAMNQPTVAVNTA